MASMVKSSYYYTLANILPQGIGFLFLPVYSRYMTPSDFGIVAAMETLAAIFSIVVCFGLDRAAQRLYFDDSAINEKKKMLSTLFISTILFSVVFVLLALLLEPILQRIFSGIPFYPFFAYCIVNVALNSLSLITTAYYQVSEQPRKYMLLRLARLILQILITMFFVVWIKQGAIGQLKAELVTLCFFLPVYIIIASQNFGWQFDFEILKKAMNYSWPFLPTLLVAWILNLSDRVFLEHYLGLDKLGVYSMGYKISMAFLVLTGAFTMAYMPMFYKLANSENQVKAKETLYKYGWLAATAFTFIMFIISLFSKEVVIFALDAKYEQSYGIIRIIIISHWLSAIMGVTSVLYLLQAKKTKLNMYIAMQAALLNIILNFLLIPLYGTYGAAVATVLSLVGLTIIQYHKSKAAYFIPVPWGKIIYLFILLVTIIAAFHFYVEKFPIFSIISKTSILIMFILFVAFKKNHIHSVLLTNNGLK